MITRIDSTRNSTPFKARIDEHLAKSIAAEPTKFTKEAIDSFCTVLKEVSNDVKFNYRPLMDIDFHSNKAKNIIFVKLRDLVDAANPDELLRKITPKKINDTVENIILPKDKSLTSLKESFNAKDKLWYTSAEQMGVGRNVKHYIGSKGGEMLITQNGFLASLSPKALENMAEVAKMEHIDFKLSCDRPFNEKNVKILVASNNQRAKGSPSLTFHEYCDVKDIETRFTPEQITEFEAATMSRTQQITNQLKRFIAK